MDIAIFFPFLLLIGVMFLMTRSAKNRQRQAMEMRNSMAPGTGIRTVGGMYAQVKEVREDTVLVEIEPGVHAVFAKNAIGAVLDPEEYERIVNDEPEADDDDAPVVPDDASSLTEGESDEPDDGVDLGKRDDDGTEEPKAAKEKRDNGAEGDDGSKS
ncbi:preprotein translocase subunit YajC [Streptomyces sp. B6B3]|uniref:preprotein translocase subunit YajC n=1 Tax=Streptomyces sp. B6B3 TaxID=3153570 RepID=UPI00325DE2F9